MVVGHDGEERAGFRLDVKRLAHLEIAPRGLLRGERRTGGSARETAARCRRRSGGSLASISMMALSIPMPGERGEHVLDGLHLHRAFGDGGGALDRFDVLDARIDRRLVREVDPFELRPAVRRGGTQGEGDFFAGMQGGAGEAGGPGERLLVGGEGHAELGGRGAVARRLREWRPVLQRERHKRGGGPSNRLRLGSA